MEGVEFLPFGYTMASIAGLMVGYVAGEEEWDGWMDG